MARPYLAAMLAGALLAAGATAAFIWAMDPLGIYASPRIEGVNALKPALKTRSRIFKTVQVASHPWEALIVGTSRADSAIDPRHPFFGGARCFNAAMAGQSLDESLALVRTAAGRGALRRALLMLDFEVSNAHYEGAPDYVPENYRPWRKLTLALNTQMLALAARMPFTQDRELVLRDDALWMPDGRFVYPGTARGPRAAALVSEAEYIEKNFFRGPARQYALAAGGAPALDSVRKLVRFAHDQGIELTMALSPVHARQLEAIAAVGLWRQWEEWKRAVAAINEDEAARRRARPFPLWDFSGYNEVTTEPFPPLGDAGRMRWHFESSHYTPETGALVLERMAGTRRDGIGVVLTTSNVEAQLAAARQGRSAWRSAHPRDVAEIEQAARRLGRAT